MKIKLNWPFDMNSNVDGEDVLTIKRTLNWLGYYTPPKDIGLSDYTDGAIFKAIKDFQTDQKIPPTGTMRTDGATIEALSNKLSHKLEKQ